MIVLPIGSDIIDVKIGDPGPTSDINQFRERQDKFAQEQKFKGDKAYIGSPQISTPHKKPRNKQLTQEQKQENTAVFSEGQPFIHRR